MAIVCAGTSDVPVAEEAAVSCAFRGNEVKRIYDVGVAGLHRVLDQRETLEKANEIVEEFLERSKTKSIPLYEFALIFNALGDNDKAFEYLEQMYETKTGLSGQLRFDPAAPGQGSGRCGARGRPQVLMPAQ